MVNQDFTKTFLYYIQPGHRILDLGAGQGIFTQKFIERGSFVTAVDSQLSPSKEATILSEKMTVEEFCRVHQNGLYDLIFARNILQFLDKQWVYDDLFPWMEEHTTAHGIIAIETFYQNPEPRFRNFMRSLYSLKELCDYFFTWNEILAREYSHQGVDMDGKPRKFYISSLIIQKNMKAVQ